jgi:hypothetical protein
MKRTRITATEAAENYWSVVANCLRVFHHKRSEWITDSVAKLQAIVEDMPPQSRDLYYHAEPFDVACRLAEKELDVKAHLKRYLQLRDGVVEAH